MNHHDNKNNRYGSSRFAHPSEYHHHTKPDETAVYLAHDQRNVLWGIGKAGILTAGGARSGKMTTQIAHQIMNPHFKLGTVALDIKGEDSMTFTNFTHPMYFWNPTHSFKDYLPCHSMSPLDHITDNINYVSECIDLAKELVPTRSEGNSSYFTGRGQEIISGVMSGIVEHTGSINYGVLYDLVSSVTVNDEVWPSWAFEFEKSKHPHVRKAAAEITQNRFNQNSSGGFQGIWGEITAVLQPLADPQLYDSLTPPFDVSLAEFHTSKKRQDLKFIVSPDKIEAMSGILRSFFLNAFKHKIRNPSARQQYWRIDEAAKLGTFGLLEELFTLGAGLGIRAHVYYQSLSQVAYNSPARDANPMLSSVGTMCLMTVRDMASAKDISDRLGSQTLEYDDRIKQAEAAAALRKAIAEMIARGRNPTRHVMQLKLLQQKASTREKQHRKLLLPEEILRLGNNSQIVITDGVEHPILARRSPYYDDPQYAGKYLPNPYFDKDLDSVRVRTRWGYKVLPVVTEKVDPRFAHLPQFSHGTWRYVKGYRP